MTRYERTFTDLGNTQECGILDIQFDLPHPYSRHAFSGLRNAVKSRLFYASYQKKG